MKQQKVAQSPQIMTLMIVRATLITIMMVMATLMTMMMVMARDAEMCLEGAFSWQSPSSNTERSRALHVNADNGCNTRDHVRDMRHLKS